MQAEDISLQRTPHPSVCPLCETPLSTRGIPPYQPTAPHTIVTCSSCGFSAPFVPRQHVESSTALAARGQYRHTRKYNGERSQASSAGASVWIDPAVSAFLGGLIVDAGIGNSTPHSSSQLHESKYPQLHSITPIPPRTSDQPTAQPRTQSLVQPPDQQQAGGVNRHPKYRRSAARPIPHNSDVTRTPTLPSPSMWQYETTDYEAASSLSALSLVVDAPTHPEVARSPRSTRRLPPVDEIDTHPVRRAEQLSDIDKVNTLPPRKTRQLTDIDEIDTLPSPVSDSKRRGTSKPQVQQTLSTTSLLTLQAGKVLVPASVPSTRTHEANKVEHRSLHWAKEVTDPSSWTAGGANSSIYARRIAERANKQQHRLTFHPLDHLRWWLLHPGRIEFILWLGGTILLMTVTFVLLLVTAISFSWITPSLQFQHRATTAQNGSGGSSNPTSMPTSVTTHGLTLTLLNTDLLVPGQPLQLRGKGFTIHGTILFTDEKNHPLINQESQSNSAQADNTGTFFATLNIFAWMPGPHQLIAVDEKTGRSIHLPLILAPGPFGNSSTPTPFTPPALTATPTQNNGSGVGPTPVGSTPVPTTPTVSPTPGLTPTPTKTTPTPTPTTGITPTATPGITPTPGTTPTPMASPVSGNVSAPIVAANIWSAETLFTTTNFDALFWLLLPIYSLVMLLLGLAGYLHRHRP